MGELGEQEAQMLAGRLGNGGALQNPESFYLSEARSDGKQGMGDRS